MVKICNQLVKKVKKCGFSDSYQGGQTRGQFYPGKEPKGQTKLLGPASVI